MRSNFRLRHRFISHVLFPFIGLASIACGSSSAGNPSKSSKDDGELGPVVASAPIGPQGGALETPDGALKVDLPPGALGDTTEISVRERVSPGEGEVGVVYEIGPTGTQFTSPVTLTIAYSPDDLGGRPESELAIATFADGHWKGLADNVVDTKNHSVSGTTMHLSPYADVILPPEADSGVEPNGAGGSSGMVTMPGAGGTTTDVPAADAGVSPNGGAPNGQGGEGGVDPGTAGATGAGGSPNVTGTGGTDTGTAGATSQGGTKAGGGQGGTGGVDTGTAGAASQGGTTGGGGTAGTDPGSAGATSSSGGTTGVGGTVGSGAGTGVGGSAGAPASGGHTCFSDGAVGPLGGPYPSCATADPCSVHPGAVLVDCVDSPDGYKATCCSPTDPAGTGGMSGGGGTTGSGGTAGTGAGTGVGGRAGAPNSGGACFGAGAAGPAGGPYPSCATSDPCVSYPGTVLVDCVDSPDGYKATCCSPTDPAGTGGMSGGGGTTGSGGTAGTGAGTGVGGRAGAPSSGGGCFGAGAAGPPGGPYPSCATSDPCASYPGTVLVDCVDSPDGYKATCCSPTDPAGTGGMSGGGGTTGSGGTAGTGAGTGVGGRAGAPSSGGGCFGAGAAGPPGGPYPSCATSDPCASYPDTVLVDCVDSPNGYKATCCSPTDPAGTGGTSGGGGTTGGGGTGVGGTAGAPASGGASGGTCFGDGAVGPPGGPYPLCATSAPCSSYPGTTVVDCVDSPNGYKATCCTG